MLGEQFVCIASPLLGSQAHLQLTGLFMPIQQMLQMFHVYRRDLDFLTIIRIMLRKLALKQAFSNCFIIRHVSAIFLAHLLL